MLDPDIRQMASGPNFAALTTLLRDGSPMTHMMWVSCDDNHLLCNTEVHRQKFKNVRRDPRVAVAIWKADDPYHFVEVRGTVVETVTGPAALAHIRELSHKYTGRDYDVSRIRSERVILRIAPHRHTQRRG